MKAEDELKDELRGQMGLHFKSKFDSLLEIIEKRHQSQLQALKEEVNGITNTVEFAIKENPHNREEMLLKAMNKLQSLITNLEDK